MTTRWHWNTACGCYSFAAAAAAEPLANIRHQLVAHGAMRLQAVARHGCPRSRSDLPSANIPPGREDDGSTPAPCGGPVARVSRSHRNSSPQVFQFFEGGWFMTRNVDADLIHHRDREQVEFAFFARRPRRRKWISRTFARTNRLPSESARNSSRRANSTARRARGTLYGAAIRRSQPLPVQHANESE